MSDVRYSTYFHFASDDSPRWELDKQTKGYGFGMVNMTPPHIRWYPYFVNYLFGNHLNVGDKIFSCLSSNSTAVSALAWSNNGFQKCFAYWKGKKHDKDNIDVTNAKAVNGSILIFEINGSGPTIKIAKEGFVNPSQIIESGYFVALLVFS